KSNNFNMLRICFLGQFKVRFPLHRCAVPGIFCPSGLDTPEGVGINPALPIANRQRTDRRAPGRNACGPGRISGGRQGLPDGPKACGMEEIGIMQTRIGWLALLLTAGVALAPTAVRAQPLATTALAPTVDD